jgi:hypothetical protein
LSTSQFELKKKFFAHEARDSSRAFCGSRAVKCRDREHDFTALTNVLRSRAQSFYLSAEFLARTELLT